MSIATATQRPPTERPQWFARQPHIETWKKAFGLYAGRNVAEEIRAALPRHGGTRVVFSKEHAIIETTAGALWEASAGIAAALAARGLNAGDVIVNQLPSCRETMLTFLAAMRLGLVLVPVVHIYGPAELGYILRQSRAKALVIPSRWRNIDYPARVGALGELPDLKLIVGVGGGALPGPFVPWEDLESFKGPELPLTTAKGDDVCMINFTSGTTSAPKGVMHSHHSMIAMSVRNPPVQLDIRGAPIMSFTPAGHIGAILRLPRPWLLGDEHVYVDQFEAAFVAELCERYQVRRGGGVPTHWNAILEACNGRLPGSITNLLLGATSVPPVLMRKLEGLGAKCVRSWGCTEGPCFTAGEPPDPFDKRADTDGRPVPGTLVRAVDDEGREVPRGQPGELLAIGPQLFLGYLDEELDRAAFTEDGWYRSGDIGVIDAEGYVTIVDRKKDIVLRGGENISSREVEDLLVHHPAILEAAVVGWPDERLGEKVGAFLRLRPGMSVTLDEIKALFREQGVARQKTPEEIVVVEDFQRTAAGKVLKPELRKLARAHAAGTSSVK